VQWSDAVLFIVKRNNDGHLGRGAGHGLSIVMTARIARAHNPGAVSAGYHLVKMRT
jgi:hypothetical protein